MTKQSEWQITGEEPEAWAPDYDSRWEEGHDEIDGACVRCGELTSPSDRAEVAEGLVHAQCMRPGEEVA